MEQLVRVSILDREYALRVREGEDMEVTRRIAAEVDERIRQFQEDHPRQPEITAAVITALALAEELHDVKHLIEQKEDAIEADVRLLEGALQQTLHPASEQTEPSPTVEADPASSSTGL